jgi:outer membrane receptor for ferrienterochelin and colicins
MNSIKSNEGSMMKILCCIGLMLCFSTHLLSQDDDLNLLSLEELLDVNVYTASQQEERAIESQAIISVITSEDLQNWGVRDVYEALSHLPGIYINESYMGYTTVNFRGLTQGLYNNKVLFMINGHPVFERLFGSNHLEYLPLEVIDRIEVVRSPASVLYGTNAISGVVNVITNQGKDNKNVLTIRGGSFDHYYASAVYFGSKFTLASSFQKDGGYSYSGTLTEDPPGSTTAQEVNLDYKNDIANLFIDGFGEDWRVQGAYYYQEKGRYGFNPWGHLHGTNTYNSAYVNANKIWYYATSELKLWVKYDYQEKNFDAGDFPFPSGLSPNESLFNEDNKSDTHSYLLNDTQRTTVELQYKDQISKDTSYLVGLSYDYDASSSMDFFYYIDDTRNNNGGFKNAEAFQNYAGYAQYKSKFGDKLLYTLGVRAEGNTDTGYSGLIPRVGLSYELNKQEYLKLLYSEAFRTPIFLEKYTLVPNFLYGTLDLDREQVSTLELAYEARLNKKNKFKSAVFGLELRNEIARRAASPNGFEYYNGAGKDIYGLELEWTTLIASGLNMKTNVSYMDGKDNTLGVDNLPFVPKYTANAIVNYELNGKTHLMLSHQYIDKKPYLLADSTTGTIDGYNLTNFGIRYKTHKHAFQIDVRNLFDTEYVFPETQRRNLYEIPGGPGTSGYITYKYHFLTHRFLSKCIYYDMSKEKLWPSL